jgi:glycosyltransferase involved in cell wall biosynthesis
VQVLAGLARLGHEIEAVSPITEAALAAGDPLAGRRHGFGVTRFLLPYLDVSPDTPPDASYRERERASIHALAAEAIARERPDVVFIGRESFAEHTVAVAREHSLPSVLRVAGGTTMGILNGSYPQGLAADLLARVREVSAAVAPAHHVRRSLARLGVPGVRVIPNPVDLDRFRPRPPSPEVRRSLGAGPDDVLVAHVSNLKSLKRADDLVTAARTALREHERLVFAVVGDGPCREAVEGASAAAGLAERFRFPGWVDYAGMADVLNAADVVVMPSSAEAQARVYLEAQACGRTLVASDVPGAREVVEDGATGLLFRVGDAGDLAAAIVRAAADPDLRAELGRRARERVAVHALPRVAAAWSDLLEEVAHRRQRWRETRPTPG